MAVGVLQILRQMRDARVNVVGIRVNPHKICTRCMRILSELVKNHAYESAIGVLYFATFRFGRGLGMVHAFAVGAGA